MERSLVAKDTAVSTNNLRPEQQLTFEVIEAYFNSERRSLPFLSWKRRKKRAIEISMIAPHRVDVSMFFYEMISRWLVPLRQLHVISYFAFDQIIEKKLTIIASITVEAASDNELHSIEMMLPILFEEIKLGFLSSYHAKRILEIKGLSISDKMGFVLDHLRKVIKRFPELYDYDLIPLMQRFFIHKSDEYRNNRSVLTLEKTVLSIYRAFRRMQVIKGEERYIDIRVRTQYITQLFGEKKVLCLTVGLSYVKDNERFTKHHLERALSEILPAAHIVSESRYVEVNPEEKSRVYSLELEFEKAPEKSYSKKLQRELPRAIQMRIEQLTKPLVMPRNDEEVMKHMILLAGQLTSPKDIPQMILSFREQTEQELVFTLILARVLKDDILKMEAVIEKEPSLQLEKVRVRGMVWKKYPKELSVLRVTIPLSSEERFGKKIHYLRARSRAQEIIERLIGPVRDYFGGMYEKEQRGLEQLISELKDDGISGTEIEVFYQGLFPSEYRSILSSKLLAQLFRLFMKIRKEQIRFLSQNEESGMVFVLRFERKKEAKNILNEIESIGKEKRLLILFFREEYELGFVGGIDFGKDQRIVSIIQKALEK